jgi:hypothetical protein
MNTMQEKSVHRSTPEGRPRQGFKAITLWIRMNPFLTFALIAMVVRYGLPLVSDEFDEGIVGWFWLGSSYLLTPFSIIATYVDPYLSPFSEFVDLLGTAVLGILPYLIIDMAYRRMIWHRLSH